MRCSPSALFLEQSEQVQHRLLHITAALAAIAVVGSVLALAFVTHPIVQRIGVQPVFGVLLGGTALTCLLIAGKTFQLKAFGNAPLTEIEIGQTDLRTWVAAQDLEGMEPNAYMKTPNHWGLVRSNRELTVFRTEAALEVHIQKAELTEWSPAASSPSSSESDDA